MQTPGGHEFRNISSRGWPTARANRRQDSQQQPLGCRMPWRERMRFGRAVNNRGCCWDALPLHAGHTLGVPRRSHPRGIPVNSGPSARPRKDLSAEGHSSSLCL